MARLSLMVKLRVKVRLTLTVIPKVTQNSTVTAKPRG